MGEIIRKVMLVLLAIAIAGLAISCIARAKAAVREADAYIAYLDAKHGW